MVDGSEINFWNWDASMRCTNRELLKKNHFFLEWGPYFKKKQFWSAKNFNLKFFSFWFLLTGSFDHEIHPRVSFYVKSASFHTHNWASRPPPPPPPYCILLEIRIKLFKVFNPYENVRIFFFIFHCQIIVRHICTYVQPQP